MCWACNPFCGRCKPPKLRLLKCPSCHSSKAYSKEELLGPGGGACPFCSASLVEAAPVESASCRFSGLECAWPCQRFDKEAPEGQAACPYNTPPRRQGEDL